MENAKAKTYIPHLKEWVLRPKGQDYNRGAGRNQHRDSRRRADPAARLTDWLCV